MLQSDLHIVSYPMQSARIISANTHLSIIPMIDHWSFIHRVMKATAFDVPFSLRRRRPSSAAFLRIVESFIAETIFQYEGLEVGTGTNGDFMSGLHQCPAQC